MQLRKLNKKGDATDVFIVMVILFFLAVSFIIGIFVNDKLITVIKTTALNESAAAPVILNTFENLNAVGIQRAFVLIFVLMVIFVVASAFLTRVHPFWIWIYFIMLIVTILTSVLMSNTFGALIDNPELGNVIASQPMITFFMQNSVTIALAVSAFSMIIVFSKLFSAPTGGSISGF